MRADRPIGTYLVLWPTLWSLWLAADGFPDLVNLIIFCVGCFTMRSAGCVINDFADRDFDKHVERTKDRPLTTGEVTKKEAMQLFSVLVLISFVLVLFTNIFTLLLAPAALLIASIYPFMKRHTHLPQVVLGAAFSWSIPMAYAAQANDLSAETWWVFLANLLWVVAYDTYYAMVDRNDDEIIGIRSTAILFGRFDRAIIVLLQSLFLLIMFYIGQQRELGMIYYGSLFVCMGLFYQQFRITQQRDRDACLKAFLDNNYVGLALFIGIATALL